MKLYSIFAVLFISLATGDEPQSDEQPTEINTGKKGNNGTGDEIEWRYETNDEMCNAATDVSVQSVYVSNYFIQLFIENLDGLRGWTADSKGIIEPGQTYPRYYKQSSDWRHLGSFRKMNEIGDSDELKNDGKFKRVSASFLDFSDNDKEHGYLVLGLNAYEFEIDNVRHYNPTKNVKPITDFFKEGDQKLLMPEDKLEEVVSVALIKWVEKDKIKDHALYKIILKTVTKKLVRAYFKLNRTGEITGLNSEPFVPSVELMQDEDEFNLLEESALYNVRELNKLSMGYQFTSKFAFPIYYEYNPENNSYNEYPMRTNQGFNTKLEKLADRIPYWNRYIVASETWLTCPKTIFCLGRSFDAVFFASNKYYAIFDDIVYTFGLISNTPGIGEPLKSLARIRYGTNVDAAFTFGAMVFIIANERVYYKTEINNGEVYDYKITDVFPEIEAYMSFPVSAVITLDKEEVVENIPSKLKSSRRRKHHRRHERAPQTTEDEIPKQMVYLYFVNKDGANVHQYEMKSKQPPKFKRIAKKSYNEVNAALPLHISLAFTANGKVVTMVNHFMILQSSLTFFTKTEEREKFTLLNNYFGCRRENIEKKLSKDFLLNYVKFACPKPGLSVVDDPADRKETTEPAESTTQDNMTNTDSNDFGSPQTSEELSSMSKSAETLRSPTESNDEDKSEVKDSGTSAQTFTTSLIIEAVLIIIFGLILI